MLTRMKMSATVALVTIGLWPSAAYPAPEDVTLGTVAVGSYRGQVIFECPADDGVSYRVGLAIPKPAKDPAIKAERIDVWLLARGGKTLASKDRALGSGVLVEAGNERGTTANAIFFFSPTAKREELVAVVVAVDGELTTLKVLPPKGK